MNDTLKVAGRIGAELGAAKAEIEVLREQVKVLQSDANSWQSGYDKGRNDGGKHRKSEVEQLRQHKNEYMDAAEVTRKALLAEIESLRNGLKNARYRIEQGRVWNGMGWTLTGLHAHQQQKALDEIEAALSQQPEPTDAFTAVDMATAAAQGFRDGQAAVEQATAQDERTAFEAWVMQHNTAVREDYDDTDENAPEDIRLDRQGGVYIWANAEAAWFAWKARSALDTRPAQTEQQPSAAQQILDLIMEECRYWHGRDEARRWNFANLYAAAKELADNAAPIAQTAPQPEQSGLVEPTLGMVQAACAAFRMDVSPMEAMTEALRAVLSAQGAGDASA